MLGLDRRTLQIAWTLFLFALTLLVIYRIGYTLIIFAVALIFAQLLAPVVNFVERRFPPRVPRVWSLLIVYVVLLGALAAIMIPLFQRLSQEAAALTKSLPDVLQSDPLARFPVPRWLEPLRPNIDDFLRGELNNLDRSIGPMLTRIGTRVVTGIGSALGIVLIPILSFFFLKDGTLMRDEIVDSFSLRRRELVDNIFSDIHLLLAQYIRALVLLSLATFTFYSIFLGLMRMPFPLLLAGAAAALEFIPAVGPLAAAIIIIIVGAASGFSHMIVLILFFLFYRIFQDYMLNPYVMSAGVELHPLLVLFGVLAGDELLGIPGMFFSVPAMAALRLILIRLRRRAQTS
ncbi:MAG TPA: AI-2E family transporter [Bryobacteraceae bacterium]|jgi:predicted PurR-regulated permease PerM|nr:AI-2E family transporter [Bryobacteraceae bacterium]